MRENPELVFLDVEWNDTSGTQHGRGRGAPLIAVAAQKAELTQGGLESVGEPFYELIHPGCQLTEEAKRITGLTDLDLKDKPTFSGIEGGLREYLGDGVIFAHEAFQDVSRLCVPFFAHGLAWTPPVVCTRIVAEGLSLEIGNRFSLELLCRHFNVQRGVAHQALGDVQSLMSLVKVWMSHEQIAAAVHAAIERANPPNCILSLPTTPGVLKPGCVSGPIPRLTPYPNMQRDVYDKWLKEHCRFPAREGDISTGNWTWEAAPGFFTATHRVLEQQKAARPSNSIIRMGQDDWSWAEGENHFLVPASIDNHYILNRQTYQVHEQGAALLGDAVRFCRRQQEKAKQNGNKNA